MMRLSYLALLFVALATGLSAQGPVPKYNPPLLPFAIVLGQQGIRIEVERSVQTPFGELGVEVSGTVVSQLGRYTAILQHNPGEKAIEIAYPRHLYSTRFIERPLLRLREMERVGVKQEKEYLIELKNYKGRLSQTFLIKGLDVCIIEAVGAADIEASDGHFVINLKEGNVRKITFRGGQLTPGKQEDILRRLCGKFNQRLGNIFEPRYQSQVFENGFWVFGFEPNPAMDGPALLRRLQTKFGIGTAQRVIASYCDGAMVVADQGLFLDLSVLKLAWTKSSQRFFPWSALYLIEFEQQKGEEGRIYLRESFSPNSFAYLEAHSPYKDNSLQAFEIIDFLYQAKEALMEQ